MWFVKGGFIRQISITLPVSKDTGTVLFWLKPDNMQKTYLMDKFSFLTNLGGGLGLFLGFSVFTSLSALYNTVVKLSGLWSVRNRQQGGCSAKNWQTQTDTCVSIWMDFFISYFLWKTRDRVWNSRLWFCKSKFKIYEKVSRYFNII